MTVLFMYNLRSLFNKFPTIFESLIFRISLTKLIYFSKKREADIFGFENVMECDGEESEKFLLSYNFKLHLKCSGK